jgi:hypothetical protein
MSYIREQIIEAAKELNTPIEELSHQESERIGILASNKFAGGAKRNLWEHFESSVSIQNQDAWKWIEDYVENRQVLMFFELDNDEAVFLFPNASSIVSVLEKTANFEFYLTDTEATYIICFNHHNYLIASGAAEGWLTKRITN